MKSRMTRLWTVLFVAGLFGATVPNAWALGYDKKSPEEEQAENARKATVVYNEGVELVGEAKVQLALGDSLRAFSQLKDASKAYLHALDKFKKAVKKYEKAVDLNPEFAEAYSNLGYCRRNVGEHENALKAYDRALQLNPDLAEALEYRGVAYVQMGRRADAMADLSRLKKLDTKLAGMLEEAITAVSEKQGSTW